MNRFCVTFGHKRIFGSWRDKVIDAQIWEKICFFASIKMLINGEVSRIPSSIILWV